MKVNIKMRRSPKDPAWLGYVGGKLIPLVHLNESAGVTAENVYSVAKGLYPQFKLDPSVVEDALELLCKNDLAKRRFKPINDGGPKHLCYYVLTSKGTTDFAAQFMLNSSEITVEIVD